MTNTKENEHVLTYNYYKTNVGFYFKIKHHNYYHNVDIRSAYGIVSINDIPVADIPLLHSGWYKIDSEITKVVKLIKGISTKIGFQLDNPKYTSEAIPTYFDVNTVEPYYDDDKDEFVWTTYDEIRHLYSPVFKSTEDTFVEMKLNGICLGEYKVNNPELLNEFSVEKVEVIREGGFGSTRQTVDLSSIVTYEEIEKLLTPEFALHTRPCELSSKQMYQIVRAEIISKLDKNQAVISSNYDFCFEVQKLVHTKPFATLAMQKKGRHWKTVNTTSTVNKICIFKMSYDNYKNGKPYEGYPAIPALKAKSLKELSVKLREYLDDLIDLCNSPLHECENCNGKGMLFKSVDFIK